MSGSSKTTPNTERRVYIVSTPCVQTRSLGQIIAERVGSVTSVQNELRVCASAVSVANHPTVILVDSLFLTPHAALDQLEQLPGPLGSHVVIAFINVPDDSGVEARAVALGVRGLFPASVEPDFLVRGVSALFDGEVWVPREILVNAIASACPVRGGNHHHRNTQEILTQREREILALISTGASNDEIATKLNISTNTVRTHVYNLYHKIHVPNRMQAVLWGAENL